MLTLGNVINFLSDAVGLIQNHFAFNKIIPIYASIMIKIRILIKLNKFNKNNSFINFIHVSKFLSRLSMNFTDNPHIDNKLYIINFQIVVQNGNPNSSPF